MGFAVVFSADGCPALNGRLPLYVLRDVSACHVHRASDNHLPRREPSPIPQLAQSVVRPRLSFLSRRLRVLVVRTGTVHARERLSGLRIGAVQRSSNRILASVRVRCAANDRQQGLDAHGSFEIGRAHV